MSLSITEAEYISLVACCTQVLWMKQTLKYVHVEYDQLIPIFCDNISAVSISKNLVMHSKTKHIPIKYHFVKERVAENIVKLEYVDTNEKIVNIFMKPLPKETFACLRRKLGIVSAPQ